jgi:very-short-patch-repair endonuclease
VISRVQLYSLGLGRHGIDRRLKLGRLHPIHRGVYMVGHSVAPPRAREMAAVLACGPGAVVSHASAAALWQILPHQSQSREVDVTVPGRDPGRKPGIRVHRVRMLDPRDARSCHGVPVTTPARTLLDLASQASRRDLEQAFADAEHRRLVHPRQLLNVLARAGPRPGVPALRALVQSESPPFTRSEAEERFLVLIRAGGLPVPGVNVRVGGHEVDFLWRKEALVVEVDGFEFHSSRAAFERDRLRDAGLQAAGFRVIRVTWRQLTEQSEATLVRIARALALSSGP